MEKSYLTSHPDENGFFGTYGGAYIPPQLEAAFEEINAAYDKLSKSYDFLHELSTIRKHYQGRSTPVYYAKNLSEYCGGGQLYFKREDLNHTGAHKLNHCMAEALLAKYLGKKKIMAETGAGQHGVALTTAATCFGLECEIHMGEVDIAKEKPNVIRMQILGAKIVPVTHGLKILKEAVDSCFDAYIPQADTALYAIGSVVDPHPFPKIVRDFQSVVGFESKKQFAQMTGGMLPDSIIACVGGGSNAMGIFSGFVDDPVKLHGVEPIGKSTKLGDNAASLSFGSDGIMHGFNPIMLKDNKGEPAPVLHYCKKKETA